MSLKCAAILTCMIRQLLAISMGAGGVSSIRSLGEFPAFDVGRMLCAWDKGLCRPSCDSGRRMGMAIDCRRHRRMCLLLHGEQGEQDSLPWCPPITVGHFSGWIDMVSFAVTDVGV